MVATALDTFESEMLNKLVTIESNDQLMKGRLAAVESNEQSVKTKIAALEELIKSRSPGRKPMSELRCASNLKNLGSDKAEFKNWNERLVNVMSQAFGPEW